MTMRQPTGDVRAAQILRLKMVKKNPTGHQTHRFIEISVGRFARPERENRCIVCQSLLSETAFGYCVRDITSGNLPQVLFIFCACEADREILGQRMMDCLKLLVDPNFLEPFGGVVEEHRELQLNPVVSQLVLRIVHTHLVTLLPLMEALHASKILPPVDGGLLARLKLSWLNQGADSAVEWTFDITHIKEPEFLACCVCKKKVSAEDIFGYRIWQRNKRSHGIKPQNMWEFGACPTHHDRVQQAMEMFLANLQDAEVLQEHNARLKTVRTRPFLYMVVHHTGEKALEILFKVLKKVRLRTTTTPMRRTRAQTKLLLEEALVAAAKEVSDSRQNLAFLVDTGIPSVDQTIRGLTYALEPLGLPWTYSLEDNSQTVVLHLQDRCFVVKSSKAARKRYLASHPDGKRPVVNLIKDEKLFRINLMRDIDTQKEELIHD